MSNTIVRVKDLKKYFLTSSKTLFDEAKYVKANDGITLDIKEGETLGLVGESGSGKSTLGRVLLQLYEQTDGSTYYYGKTLEEVAPRYVIETIKNLVKDVNLYNNNQDKKAGLSETLKIAQSDSEKEKLSKAIVAIDVKIDKFFDTTVKIFGGLIFAPDLAKASKVVNNYYTSRKNIIELTKSLALEELSLSAFEENGTLDSKQALKSFDKKAQITSQLDNESNKLKQIENEIEEIRNLAKENPKYQRYQNRKDSGIDLTRLTDKEIRTLRTDLQIIFQDPYSSLDPRMTVAQIIGEALVEHGLYKKGTQKLTDYIAKVMQESGLEPHMMHRYPHQFSGGQRQRVGIARALAVNPKFIVADEAVSALDVSIQAQIMDLLKDLREKRNLTYLFISHDLGVVRNLSDRIAVMYGGHLVELASTAEIFNNPQHPYTKALLNAIPRFSNNELVFENKTDVKIDFKAYETNNVADSEWVEVRPNHFVACRNLEKVAN